jgi:hypothetical protein
MDGVAVLSRSLVSVLPPAIDGTIAGSVFSSGAIGRLVAADTISFIKYMQHQTP